MVRAWLSLPLWLLALWIIAMTACTSMGSHNVLPRGRPAYTMQGILDALLQHPLHPQCDRVFALIGRHVGDVVWGLLGLPEVLGAVDDNTSTHGYAVVQRASVNQLFMSPTSVVR